MAGGDDDDAAAGQRSGVRDGAGGGGADWLAGGAGEIDTAVAGEPRLGWLVEGADHLRAGIEWPDRGVAGRGGCGWAELGEGQAEHEEEQAEETSVRRSSEAGVGVGG
ncbi:hypothetical protein EV643_1288 [Kribbella sp. VKM Ac-2527]|uniref:Uncharacterized protein n=1 Tax=Kribbella caucasensis TaxID=2512215 RepID=A0A4R6JE89_9ACTN|nr:hypothetical protein EV643_1288 [Kribbella sp. VKM Ac-2527]